MHNVYRSVYTYTHVYICMCVYMFTFICVYIRIPNIMSKSCTKRYLAHCRFSISQPSPVRRSVRKILALLIELRSIALRQTKTTLDTPAITPAAIAALTAAIRGSLVIPGRYKLAQTVYPMAGSDVWPNHVGRIEGCDNELLSPMSTAIF